MRFFIPTGVRTIVTCSAFSLFLTGCGNTPVPTISEYPVPPLQNSQPYPCTSATQVSIADSNSGATIYYGVNSNPTTPYKGPFQLFPNGQVIPGGVIVQAYAKASGGLPSGTASADFCATPTAPSNPTFAQVGTADACNPVQVQINVASAAGLSCPTCTMVYGTEDGTAPSPTNNWFGAFPGTIVPVTPTIQTCEQVGGQERCFGGTELKAIACIANRRP
jgi:hypothetical protein